jgi:hypothetical protein
LPTFTWNPFSNSELTEVPLSKVELQKINVNAGWAKGDDQTLIFELSNGLKGPIQCGAANIAANWGHLIGVI